MGKITVHFWENDNLQNTSLKDSIFQIIKSITTEISNNNLLKLWF